jgi:hypothetical protein
VVRYRLWSGGAAVLTACALGLIGAGTPAMAAPSAPAAAGPVATTPPTDVPHLPAMAPAEQVRQLVQCGGTMYAVGSFTQVRRNSKNYTRDNVFSFSATAPFQMTSWAPAVNGVVNSITFSGGSCAYAYIGGHFSQIGQKPTQPPIKDIAKISTTTGAVAGAFAHNAEAQVETLRSYKTHILVGGYYTSINGSSADPYMTSLNSTTGKDDGFVRLHISGNYSYQFVAPNATRVFNQALSHSGTLDAVMGDFTSVGGKGRQQVFMLNLAGKTATLSLWTSPEFDGSSAAYPYQCVQAEPFYIQSAAWSPSDATLYIGTTGYHPYGDPLTGSPPEISPRTGLCDAAVAFPVKNMKVTHTWINYAGCDSLFAAAADGGAAYFAGHERFSANPDGCDGQGPGAVPASGLEGLKPGDGSTLLNSAGTSGRYTRSRGLGADDMLVTSAGLWIASDNGNLDRTTGNWDPSQSCGGVGGLAGICFLPYAGK